MIDKNTPGISRAQIKITNERFQEFNNTEKQEKETPCKYSNKPRNSQDDDCAGCRINKYDAKTCGIYNINKNYEVRDFF